MVTSTGVYAKKTPLQVVPVILLMAATGLTVTVIVKLLPVQVPVNGVTVYVAVLALLNELAKVPLIFAAPVALAPPVNPEPVGTAQL